MVGTELATACVLFDRFRNWTQDLSLER